MKSGVIKLLHNGEVIRDLIYSSVVDRNKIIEKWRKLFGKKFNQFAIQIAPYEGKVMLREFNKAA